MTAPVAGIDPHQAQFTVGIVDTHGVELAHDSFPNTAAGYLAAIDLLVTHGVAQVGIEGSVGWGAHVAIALVAAGFDAREVPAQRSAMQRRSRRLAKTDAVDAVAAARALLAEPSLGPVQTLVVYDPLVARARSYPGAPRALVEVRTLLLHHVGDQLSKLPTELRDQLPVTGKLESRLRKLETIDAANVSTQARAYRVSWLLPLIDQDRQARRQIRALERRIDELLDAHGTTLRDEPGVGPITAATLICEVGDPFRFSRESKFGRWTGTGAVALSSGEGNGEPVRHRLDIGGNRRVNSVLYIISVTQQRDHPDAQTSWPARPPRARPDAKRDAPTNATSPTVSSAACGATNTPAVPHFRRQLDKGASDTPQQPRRA